MKIVIWISPERMFWINVIFYPNEYIQGGQQAVNSTIDPANGGIFVTVSFRLFIVFSISVVL